MVDSTIQSFKVLEFAVSGEGGLVLTFWKPRGGRPKNLEKETIVGETRHVFWRRRKKWPFNMG